MTHSRGLLLHFVTIASSFFNPFGSFLFRCHASRLTISFPDQYSASSPFEHWPPVIHYINTPFIPTPRLISVGNEPFIGPTPRDFDLFVVPALNNLYDALTRVGLADKIKLTVSVNSNVLQNTYPPSKASWVTVWANQLQQIAQFIDRTGSVFSINIYPFYALSGGKNAPDQKLIFFDGGASFPDNGLTYTNILDASIDSLVAALTKAGFPNVSATQYSLSGLELSPLPPSSPDLLHRHPAPSSCTIILHRHPARLPFCLPLCVSEIASIRCSFDAVVPAVALEACVREDRHRVARMGLWRTSKFVYGMPQARCLKVCHVGNACGGRTPPPLCDICSCASDLMCA